MASGDGPDTSYSETQQKLKEECEQLWLQVQKLQEKVEEVRNPVKVEAENIALSVGNNKIKSLKAQIESQQNFEAEGLPTDKAALEALLLDDLEKTTHQLQQTATVISTQNDESKQKIDRERKWLDEQKDVNEALKTKIDDLEDGVGGNVTKQSLLKKLNKDRQAVVKYNAKRMKQLKEFIQEHMPEPTDEEVTKWAKKHGHRDMVSIPMMNMLEELINKSITTPHEPYISLSDNHWPGFVEFVLRFGIAQRHPEDAIKMRITPFHL